MTTRVTGGCLCGAVRFECGEAPIATRACWCRDCQYLAAGNATVNAIFRGAAFRATGEVRDHVSRADSGTVMRRAFCTACGTPLFSRSESRPGLVVIRVGGLDEPARYRPEGFIWTASAPPWGLLDETLPNCAGQPAPLPS